MKLKFILIWIIISLMFLGVLFIINTKLASSSSFFNNASELRIKSSNTTITFSLNTTIDYLRTNQNSIYILNATTSLGLCPIVNYSTPNSTLDSKDFCLTNITPGGGGGGSTPYVNITEEEIKPLRCGITSIEKMGLCLTVAGSSIWPGYPNAGILILVMLTYIILLLLVINKRRIPLVRDAPIYFKIIFIGLIGIVAFIIFIWMFQDCNVEQLGDLKQCVSSFGDKVWPGYPNAGLLILISLFIVIIILLFLNRKKKKKVKKRKI